MRRNRDTTVASVMADCLADALRFEPVGEDASMLSALDESGLVADAAENRELRCISWQRWGGDEAAAWPPACQVELAALRIPKGREALEMSTHAVLSRLKPGGRFFLYGANDEGIRSADRGLTDWLDDVITLETKRHCRVWSGRLRDGAAPRRPRLEDWQETVHLDLPERKAELVSLPGLFAHGRLDPGTRLLLETLQALPVPRRAACLLDYGCGAGVVSLFLQRRTPEGQVHAVDRDALALHAARQNVEAHFHQGDGWSAVDPALRFDLVASNPPLHQGKDQDLEALVDLADGARRQLAKRGRLLLVTQRPLPMGPLLGERFHEVELMRETRSFRVWSATGVIRTGRGRREERHGKRWAG